jgi:L-cysteine:1D-myo-inositol 2-amino-2-deoxy-alpha-D-glucopyranoside ligase
MPRNKARLDSWLANDASNLELLDQVRERLDDDLDTPGALAAIDAAAAAGLGVREAAELLGVNFK